MDENVHPEYDLTKYGGGHICHSLATVDYDEQDFSEQ